MLAGYSAVDEKILEPILRRLEPMGHRRRRGHLLDSAVRLDPAEIEPGESAPKERRDAGPERGCAAEEERSEPAVDEEKDEEPERGADDVDADVGGEAGQQANGSREDREAVVVLDRDVGEGVVARGKDAFGELVGRREMDRAAGGLVEEVGGDGHRPLRNSEVDGDGEETSPPARGPEDSASALHGNRRSPETHGEDRARQEPEGNSHKGVVRQTAGQVDDREVPNESEAGGAEGAEARAYGRLEDSSGKDPCRDERGDGEHRNEDRSRRTGGGARG